ncbi:hypothetical protein SNOG_03390 [Parastagonospora nodorum SN15]|uniref:Uncharacterized protein n=1 Tax=Phaeosphaeria nodorum (strain SN15 / ATCC MYA-4574 / FGSC 10173) TaxID=321614 RepID=Q0UXX4_PHANO|nr:hypothetical protein SNOG_03390 [Parastagonospora nodorum SN15]EAT88595.1 hypothetical protein SNOG_03390 [Parastagonospora nodorum SN15]
MHCGEIVGRAAEGQSQQPVNGYDGVGDGGAQHTLRYAKPLRRRQMRAKLAIAAAVVVAEVKDACGQEECDEDEKVSFYEMSLISEVYDVVWCGGGGDETATLAASELYNHESDRDRSTRNGILASSIASSYIFGSMVHCVGGGRGPGTAAHTAAVSAAPGHLQRLHTKSLNRLHCHTTALLGIDTPKSSPPLRTRPKAAQPSPPLTLFGARKTARTNNFPEEGQEQKPLRSEVGGDMADLGAKCDYRQTPRTPRCFGSFPQRAPRASMLGAYKHE